MAGAVGREAWEELIGRMVAQKRRLVEFEEYETDSTPNAGATEEQLVAAEGRLGRPLDPQHRELLSVTDGWHHFTISYSLLGTGDLGVGHRWEFGVEQAEMWFDDRWAEEIGADNDPSLYHLVVENDNGYSNNLYLFAGAATALATGAALPLPNESSYPDLYSYFLDQLDHMTTGADTATLGRFSEPWSGRNLRTDPPSIREIVAEIGELSMVADPDAGSALRPGATDAELDALDRFVGGVLHPEHRELLAAANGLSTPYYCLGDVLSTREITDGARWRDMLARKQFEEDWYCRDENLGDRGVGPALSVAARITTIPAVPFAISGTDPIGVDTRDGFVRDLLADVTVSAGPHSSSEGTVRNHLLHACWSLWWRVGRTDRNSR